MQQSHAKKGTPFPKRHTRWAVAATKGFFHDWVIQGQGFTTYLNVIAGAILVSVARPKMERQLVISFDPISSNSDIWEFQQVFLETDSQMSVPSVLVLLFAENG